jgi:hypothetical protein
VVFYGCYLPSFEISNIALISTYVERLTQTSLAGASSELGKTTSSVHMPGSLKMWQNLNDFRTFIIASFENILSLVKFHKENQIFLQSF